MDTPVKVWCAAAEDLETVLTLWGCVVFNGRTCTRHTQTHSCTRTHTSHHLRGLQNSKRLHVTGEAHATLPRLGVVNTLVAGPALPRCRVFQSALFPTRLCSPKVGTSDSPVKKLRTLGVSRHFFVWLLTRVRAVLRVSAGHHGTRRSGWRWQQVSILLPWRVTRCPPGSCWLCLAHDKLRTLLARHTQLFEKTTQPTCCGVHARWTRCARLPVYVRCTNLPLTKTSTRHADLRVCVSSRFGVPDDVLERKRREKAAR
jgi:hypothetical protein